MLEIVRLLNNPVDSDCYIITDKATGNDCIIVDPGSCDNSQLYDSLLKSGLKPQYIILTHEHFDHCWGVDNLRERFPNLKLICSGMCSCAIQDKKKNHSVFFQQPGFELKPADIILDDNNWTFEWYNHKMNFYPAQGHTASGIIFKLDNYIFTGDELIKGIRTVTKLKTGSKEKLSESIQLLGQMKGKGLTVCPGHGEMFLLDNYDLTIAFGAYNLSNKR